MVTQTSIMIGQQSDVEEFAKRIKIMMRGGEKLSNSEAMALAQVAQVTRLNPFIGEVWYIPGSGPMVGIAGARRIDQEAATERGGYSTVEVFSCPPEEAGASEFDLKNVVASFRAEITDTAATLNYQKMFTDTLKELRESSVSDPVAVAREICGPRPKWVGYGYSTKDEKTRMSKVQAARKRAEADALKKKIVIPFGGEVAETDVSPDYVEAGFTDAEKHHEIGYGNLDEEYPQEGQVKELPIESTTPAPQKQSKAIAEKPSGVIGWLLDEIKIDNVSHAASIANLLKLTDPKFTKPDWERRYNNYGSLRDSGLSAKEAAQQAIAKELGY